MFFFLLRTIYMEEKAVRRRSFARGRWRRRGLQSKNAGRVKRKKFLFDAQKCLPSAEGRHLQKQIVFRLEGEGLRIRADARIAVEGEDALHLLRA